MLVRVCAVRYEADGVLSFELRALDETPLPDFTAGAHIDVNLPTGMTRSYSLINPQGEYDKYMIAVNRDPQSRGGSQYLCERVRPGDVLEISPPTNNFALFEAAPLSVLIAGGIGVTPIWCMTQRLESLRRPWRLYFAARTRDRAPFVRDMMRLEQEVPGRIEITFDHAPGYRMLDLATIVSRRPTGTHFYCCGPTSMLKAFEDATRSLPPKFVHVQYFSSDVPKAQGGFDVILARAKKTIRVRPDQTILAALLENGVEVPRSCTEGVCGTCETVVLEGIPDHRDKVLSQRERDSNRKMMICCSGSIGDRLVLDI
jgi:tetrachlorobenzoquinone reductase